MKKKALNVDIPEDLYYIFAQQCLDLRLSKTDAIIKYIKHFQEAKNETKPRKLFGRDIVK